MPVVPTLAAVPQVAAGLTGLGVGRYLLGCAAIVAVVLAVGHMAAQVRRVLLPWRGAPARLVEVTVALGFVSAVAFVLGGLRLFSGWPLFLGLVAGAVVVDRLAARRPAAVAGADAATGDDENGDDDGVEASDRVPRAPAVEWVIATVALAVVGAQWISHTASALGKGMTEGDTLWYHAVFAARFVQEGRLDIFPVLGNAAQGYFPANSQMLHGLAFFPFDRDLLSPLLNLLLAGVALLAAYCVGRRRGLGPICLIAGAAVMGIPGIVGTHPGQATNDFLCATFLLLAVALLVEGEIEPVPLALAGVAAALSVGTKLTVAVPLAVLTVVVVVIAVRRRRAVLVAAWLVPLTLLSAFWFIRNWIRADNPLPFYDITLGPLHFPRRGIVQDDASVADHLFESDTWSRVFRPGLGLAFGPAWPVFVVAPLAAALGMLGRGRRTGELVAGIVALAAGVGYVFMPYTMELGGAAFAATARYAAPPLLLGAVVVVPALRIDRWRAPWRTLAAVGWLAVVLVDAFQRELDRYAPWNVADRPLAIVIVVVALGLGALLWFGGRPARLLLVVPVVLGVVLAGFFVQRHYLEHRYAVGTGLRLDREYEYVSKRSGDRIVPFSTIQFSPLFGPSFASDVLVFRPPLTPRSGDPAVRCREWQRALADAHPTLLLQGRDGVATERPDPAWLQGSPSLRAVVRDHGSVLYRVRPPLRLACPPGG